jgi:anti-sigma factor RsiW
MTMNPITEDDLHGFVDQRLEPKRLAEVRAYLAEHPEISARIAGYAEQRETLRAALAPIAEEPLPTHLNLARMIETRRHPRPVSPWWLSAAAGVALALLGGAGGWSLKSLAERPTNGVASLALEAADSYAVFAPDRTRPIELRATDRAELVAWAGQRLGHPVAVPDLSGSGYRFMGGRLVATEHGPAVLFMYDDDHGTRLVMLTRPMETEQNAKMSPLTRGAINGFAWADHGIGYSLVGSPPPEALHPIADEARRQIAHDA